MLLQLLCCVGMRMCEALTTQKDSVTYTSLLLYTIPTSIKRIYDYTNIDDAKVNNTHAERFFFCSFKIVSYYYCKRIKLALRYGCKWIVFISIQVSKKNLLDLYFNTDGSEGLGSCKRRGFTLSLSCNTSPCTSMEKK